MFVDLVVPATYLGETGAWFYVGFYANGGVDEPTLVGDETEYQAMSWYTYAPTGAGNIDDLSANTIPPTLIGELDLPLNWLVRGAIVNTCICAADTDASGVVDVSDLLAVILAWGACDGCPADIDGNGIVDVQDLVAVIAAWGPCAGSVRATAQPVAAAGSVAEATAPHSGHALDSTG